MKRLGTKANATANTLSTCIRLEQLRPGHFPTLGPLALLYRIALVYLRGSCHLPHISTAPPTPRTAGAANAPAARPSS
jgi:hypothetical protein